jgi:hypothetical protein
MAVSRKTKADTFKFWCKLLYRETFKRRKLSTCSVTYEIHWIVLCQLNNVNVQYLRFSQQWLWRMSSSGMWRCVHLVWTDVSKERIASIFRVEKSASEEPAWAGGCRRRFTKDLHNATSQKTAFLNINVAELPFSAISIFRTGHLEKLEKICM